MTTVGGGACWCGGVAGQPVGEDYAVCGACGGAVLTKKLPAGHFEVADDAADFYGRGYWTDYQRQRDFPDIGKRAESDLAERCLFWLERLLEATAPPGRALEIGCGHGAFVALMAELGFDAIGTELSPWVVDFARRTFGARVLQGRLEHLDLQPGFRCIAAFDVLEHLDDPLDTIRRCVDLLAPDGVLLLQTPCYRGEGPGWQMFQPDEHVHLFTETSVRLLLDRAGLPEVLVRRSLFPYDMFVVASKRPVSLGAAEAGTASSRSPVAFTALLSVWRRLTHSEADRAARFEQIQTLTALLRESEADRAARLEQTQSLTRMLGGMRQSLLWKIYSRFRRAR